VHAGEQHGARARHLHQGEPRLVLLGAVAHESRPSCRARDQLLERRKHLAAIADTQRERAVALEEGAELVARRWMEQDGFCPAFAGAEHVAVREAAACYQPVESSQAHAPGEDVGHVHIVRIEPGAREHRGHLGLAVDALLTQHRHCGSCAAGDEGRGDVLARIEAQASVQPGIELIEEP
jgi:hypothetical protein